jgi:hypothetical protein
LRAAVHNKGSSPAVPLLCKNIKFLTSHADLLTSS